MGTTLSPSTDIFYNINVVYENGMNQDITVVAGCPTYDQLFWYLNISGITENHFYLMKDDGQYMTRHEILPPNAVVHCKAYRDGISDIDSFVYNHSTKAF